MSSSCASFVSVFFQQWTHLESTRIEVISTELKGIALMQKNRTPILLSMALAALSLTTMNTAFANSYIHSSNSEKGYVVYPEHFKSDKTRAQVQAEAIEFVKNGGTDSFRSSSYPPLDRSQASNKSRKQVMDEFLNESPEQRRARLAMYRG